MTVAAVLQVLIPLAAGAVIGIVPNLLIEARKDRNARFGKWSDALYGASVEFVTAARRVEHILESMALGLGEEDAGDEHLDAEHQRTRAAREQIMMLGNVEVQQAARHVLDDVYSIRTEMRTGDDPQPRRDGLSPGKRLAESRVGFYKAVRRQLRIPDAEDIAPRIPRIPATPNGTAASP